MTDDPEQSDVWALTPTERFERMPRPLAFIRVRLQADGQADYIRDLLDDEKEDLLKDLADMRIDGKDEGDAEIIEVRAHLNHLIRAIRDIDSGRLELAGGR